jgi:hypothetical protein
VLEHSRVLSRVGFFIWSCSHSAVSSGKFESMPFLIKAVSTSGIVTWLTRPGTEGSRSIASRSLADVLATAEDAWAEIARMPKVFKDAGIRFSVVETCEEVGAARRANSQAQRHENPHAIRGQSQ